MLHPRLLIAGLAALTLLSASPALGQPTCASCRKPFSQGYEIGGRTYCLAHYQQGLPQCHNCGSAIVGDYRLVGVPGTPFCMPCSQSHRGCFLCAAPSDPRRGGKRLSDGRDICASDLRTAVFTQTEASVLFTRATREVRGALGSGMSLKVPVQAVRLVDLPELLSMAHGHAFSSSPAQGQVLGLTTVVLKSQGRRRWTEPATVHLLSGVPLERMLTVCAHEYAHVWHAENHHNYALTGAEFREGFAEWVAYKVSQHTKRSRQVALLNHPNDGVYYEGLQKFLALERRLGVAQTLRHAITATRL